MGFWQNIFYNKSIRRLREMLESVRMRDFSLQYSLEKLSGEERRMAEEINSVIREFRETEHRREGESHFYDALLSKVDSILIATDEAGRVRWMNKAAVDGLCGFRFESLENLATLHPSLPKQLKELRKGNVSLLSFSMNDGEERRYAASITKIFVSGIAYRLYSLQSVSTILRQGETLAQQRLIRVLTHEIMNSLTPIISLSDTLADNIALGNGRNINDEEMGTALAAISNRAKGLMEFVQRYRMLSGIAPPAINAVKVHELITSIQRLVELQMNENCNINFNICCEDAVIGIDRTQIEQVLLNLLKNALETGATCVDVTVALSDDERWLKVSVTDNGGGFTQEAADNLFTPFFTTKPGGQGIGLAVCRQIMSNHGGFVGAECTEDGNGARFTLRLPMTEV
jgi:nitrogen fixation/metabolism regulation signal transduction histidine kinase